MQVLVESAGLAWPATEAVAGLLAATLASADGSTLPSAVAWVEPSTKLAIFAE